jgi:hypothetical protein
LNVFLTAKNCHEISHFPHPLISTMGLIRSQSLHFREKSSFKQEEIGKEIKIYRVVYCLMSVDKNPQAKKIYEKFFNLFPSSRMEKAMDSGSEQIRYLTVRSPTKIQQGTNGGDDCDSALHSDEFLGAHATSKTSPLL